MSQYVVATYTFGSFDDWATGPLLTLAEARDFVDAPPAPWAPRPQDTLRIFRLDWVQEDDEE